MSNNLGFLKSGWVLLSLAIGVAALIAFLLLEARSQSPFIRR